jgi:3-methyladenine DNA glycosylase AlkD
MDNWAVCDTICCNIKWIKDKEALWEYLRPYFDSDREFEVRFAVVMSMIFFLDAESFQKVTARLDSIDFSRIQSEFLSPKEAKFAEQVRGVAKGERPYYVRMAVAWLLATALAKLPDQTRAYVNACNLPEDVIRLYKRKARESFRTRDVNPL